MAEKMTSINPAILVWARNESGASLDEVKEKFGDRLEDWENGTDYPTYLQLQQLCDFYRKPIAICFFPEPPVIKNLSASFRTIPSNVEDILFSRRIVQLIDEARTLQINLGELNNNINPQYAFFSTFDFATDIPTMAKQLRDVLGADLSEQKRVTGSSEHFEYWRDKFSQIGIYVFKSPFKDNDTSGFCLYDDVFPIIYINNSLSFTRQTFTLFHEICHILYKTSGIDILNDNLYHSSLTQQNLRIEINCNAFAGAFLVPDDDFLKRIQQTQPTEEVVSRLAASYHVSREVILRKFLDLGLVTQKDYQERSMRYTEDYYRSKGTNQAKESSGNYYNNQSSYKGKKYTELVFQKYYANQITLAQTAQYMNMKIPSIRALAEKRGWGTL